MSELFILMLLLNNILFDMLLFDKVADDSYSQHLEQFAKFRKITKQFLFPIHSFIFHWVFLRTIAGVSFLDLFFVYSKSEYIQKSVSMVVRPLK